MLHLRAGLQTEQSTSKPWLRMLNDQSEDPNDRSAALPPFDFVGYSMRVWVGAGERLAHQFVRHIHWNENRIGSG